MSDQNNTPPPHDVELKFQMQAMTKMIERRNFMMRNVCDKLEKVGIHGNMAGTCSQDMRKVGPEPKSNNGSGAERPKWFDYADFKEDVDDIGDGGFKDETIGHRQGFQQHRNRRDFMYFDEVLWQKKMRIQKERWYQRERNKEISVLKNESKSLSRNLGEMKQELDVLTTTVNAQQLQKERRKYAAMMIYEIERLLLSSKVVGDDCWQEKISKGFKTRLRNCAFNLLVI
jgi:hypothetical protein